jgi:DNA-binding NarL/FixJ family response regulator
MPTRILVVDDDSNIRLLLRRLLEGHAKDWEVCGEASNGREAIAQTEQLQPDLIVMDQSMPVMTGMQAASEISRLKPEIPMLLITVQEMSSSVLPTIRNAGFRGVVTKNSGFEVLRGIEALLRKETFFDSNGTCEQLNVSTV